MPYFCRPPVSPIGSNCEGCVEADETIEVYLNRDTSFDFSKYNTIKNCTIYSQFYGDGASFFTPAIWPFINNVMHGAMVSVYMDRDTIVAGNTIYDSVQSGIYVSLPSENVTVSNNLIVKPRYHGIVMKPQYHEHGRV